MSIILEALKKTQASMSHDVAENSQPEILPDILGAKTSQKPSKKALALSQKQADISWRIAGMGSIMAMILVAAFGAFSLYDLHKPPARVAFAQKSAPLPAAPYLVLNGTMLEGAHRLAVINDQTYSLGDTVDNKKIVAILSDRVMLRDGANLLELKARA